MPNKNNLKVEENILYWFNGEKWLIKETFKNNASALAKLEELNGKH